MLKFTNVGRSWHAIPYGPVLRPWPCSRGWRRGTRTRTRPSRRPYLHTLCLLPPEWIFLPEPFRLVQILLAESIPG